MELISRDEAKRKITEELDSIDHVPHWVYERLSTAIESIPTVEVRKDGKWIDADKINELLDTYLANCSVCNCQMDVHENRGYFKYCPNCGAKMYEDDKDIYVPNKGE